MFLFRNIYTVCVCVYVYFNVRGVYCRPFCVSSKHYLFKDFPEISAAISLLTFLKSFFSTSTPITYTRQWCAVCLFVLQLCHLGASDPTEICCQPLSVPLYSQTSLCCLSLTCHLHLLHLVFLPRFMLHFVILFLGIDLLKNSLH